MGHWNGRHTWIIIRGLGRWWESSTKSDIFLWIFFIQYWLCRYLLKNKSSFKKKKVCHFPSQPRGVQWGRDAATWCPPRQGSEPAASQTGALGVPTGEQDAGGGSFRTADGEEVWGWGWRGDPQLDQLQGRTPSGGTGPTELGARWTLWRWRPEQSDMKHVQENSEKLVRRAISKRPISKFGAGEAVPEPALPELE